MAKLTDARAFDGETLFATFNTDPGIDSVTVTLKDGASAAVIEAEKKSPGVFDFKTDPQTFKDFTGRTNWVAMANASDGVKVIASGSIYIRPLRSKFREVVDAIDAVIQTWGQNPNQTVTVGEVSITAKNLDELLTIRASYQAKADADEAGVLNASGPKLMKTRF